MATIMPTKCGMIDIAVENPSFAPSTNDSYTGTFLVKAYNGMNAIMTGMAHADIALIHVSNRPHPFPPAFTARPLPAPGGFVRRIVIALNQRSAIMAAKVAIAVARRVEPTISAGLAD